MSDDIEEFLRRAAARRQQRQDQQRRPAQQAPQAPPRQAFPPAQPPVPEIQIVEPEVVEAETVREPLAEQVQDYFGKKNLISGDEVDQADEQMDAHLHEVFDHTLGQLRDTSVGVEEPQELPTLGDGQQAARQPGGGAIADMFRSPKNLRQAIILSEILNRPYDDL